MQRSRLQAFHGVLFLAFSFGPSTSWSGESCQNRSQVRLPVEDQVGCLLADFDKDPAAFMSRILEKQRASGDYRLPVEPLLTQALGSAENFVEVKDRFRSYVVGESVEFFGDTGRAPIEPNDRPEDLVDAHEDYRGLITSLTEIEASALLEGASDIEPWSDYYWPIYRGQLGNRYANSSLAYDWIERLGELFEPFNFILDIIKTSSPSDLKNLSPSEKYDLLIGDLSDWESDSGRGYQDFWSHQTKWDTEIPPGYLTPGQWHTGQVYYNQSETKEIETWMGLCHGWSAASYTMPRPSRTVTVLAADGQTPLEFRPTDIKGLMSQAWSEARFRSRFIGGRCNVKEPQKDEVGRVTDPDCFDTNPGTWHLTVVNQIGRNRSSFVMDATQDYEVWNYPVIAYRSVYFHPVTKKRARSWREAAVRIDDPQFVEADLFRKYRFLSEEEYQRFPHKRPIYVVGVGMEVEYVAGSAPSEADEDSPDYDQIQSVTYIYDLEVNAEGHILGGEWYSNAHPDFLWHIPQELVFKKPYYTAADLRLRRDSDVDWKKGNPVPMSWRQPAKRMSQSKRTLGHIVDQLVEWSQE